MTWYYSQSSGELSRDGISVTAQGYSGYGNGKNNPVMQDHADVGPVPRGTYVIGKAQTSGRHGPLALPLIPDPANEMHGRSAFLIHGDSLAHLGGASRGCIILPRGARQRIVASHDSILQVVAGSVLQPQTADAAS